MSKFCTNTFDIEFLVVELKTMIMIPLLVKLDYAY